jgi:6-pyruvoyltetrahydropterin/6-carboxytetrahydropterin synthase
MPKTEGYRGVSSMAFPYSTFGLSSTFGIRPSAFLRHLTFDLRHLTPMFLVSREIDFCYGHRLLNYAGKCRHLHGHNGRALITFRAESLDDRGMVLDFGEIKNLVSRWIDDNLDHRMVLQRDDPAVPVLQQLGEPVYLLDVNPTAENIAKLIFDVALAQGVPVVEVRVWETPRCCATYHQA